jgi:hypothetical protein
MDGTNAMNQIFETSVFQKIRASSGPQAAVHVFVSLKRGEDDDSRVAELLADRTDCLDAVHLGHPEV